VKVLHVMPSLDQRFGGPPVALAGFVRAAALAGWTSDVVSLDPGPDSRQWIAAELNGASVHLSSNSFALWSHLRRAVEHADVVHVHGTFNPVSSAGMWRGLLADRPVVVRPFGTLSRYTFSRRPALKHVYHAAIDSPALRRAAAIHFTTESERIEASRLRAVDASRSRVVPPPWPLADGPRLQRQPRTSSGKTVLYLSRIHQKKGIEMLVDAWPSVCRQVSGARLVIAGDDSDSFGQAIRTRVAALEVRDSIEFVGFATGEAKARWLANADVFVLPSLHENFGIAVVEALFAGLPVVVSPGVALAEFIQQRGLGVVAQPTAKDIAAAVLRVLTDRELCTHCAAAGPDVVAETFGPRAVADQLDHMYRAALETHQSL
jgi:glycosyltransferase involved in cell wall biosynthesis